MITVEIVRKNGYIIEYSSQGHADSVEVGYDLICASVSVCLQQATLYIDSLKLGCIHKQERGLYKVQIMYQGKKKREQITPVLDSMIMMLNMIKKNYPQYIKLVNKVV